MYWLMSCLPGRKTSTPFWPPASWSAPHKYACQMGNICHVQVCMHVLTNKYEPSEFVYIYTASNIACITHAEVAGCALPRKWRAYIANMMTRRRIPAWRMPSPNASPITQTCTTYQTRGVQSHLFLSTHSMSISNLPPCVVSSISNTNVHDIYQTCHHVSYRPCLIPA